MLQESLSRKLKLREKRLRNVEEDNKQLKEEAQGTAKESETAIRSKEELGHELKQTKTQVGWELSQVQRTADHIPDRFQG